MAGLGGRRQRRRWQLIGGLCTVVIIACAVYAVWQISHGGLEPSDTAGLLGLPLAAAGLAAALRALRKPVEGNDAERARSLAATLATQVEEGESVVWRQLLGDDIRRINVTYLLHPAAVRPAAAPPAGRLSVDSSGSGPATVPNIVTYYRATRPSRLVITGAPGAGKTVLALELLLALINGRAEGDPVPVRIPLSRWNTERQSLPDLLRQWLVEAYDWPADLAADLVDHHLVLPVLDGLDEMDPPRADGSPDPAAPRATAVIHTLNTYQQGRDAGPLILTCRTRHYDALAPDITVLDAARIAIAPVATDDAWTYLTDRALDTTRWEPLLDHLAAHPGSALAAVLSTPWRLCLTATVYHHDGDPAELLAFPDADALDQHLLARFIPAVTRTVSNPHGYTTDNVHRWLHHLTTHLDPSGTLHPTTPAGAEATDLLLHELWPLAGRTRIRTTDALLTPLTVLATFPLVWTLPPSDVKPFGVVLIIFAVVSGLSTYPFTYVPRGVGNPLTNPQFRIDLTIGLILSFAVGLALSFVFDLAMALAFGLFIGLATTLTASLTSVQEPAASPRARDVIRNDSLAGLFTGLSSILMIGLPSGLIFGLLFGPASGIGSGLVLGLPFGLMIGLAAVASASRRYAVFLLCSRRRLPFRLGRFLDWAVTAGLMRCSGAAYQYRHRELQHWLRQHPHPPTSP